MPKWRRNILIAFEEPHLTHFAGMAPIQAFCQRLGLRRLLQQALRPAPRYRDYHPAELGLALLYAIIVELDRINATQILQYNGAFQQIVGLPQFPDATTLRRLRPRHIRQMVRLHDQFRQALFAQPRPTDQLGVRLGLRGPRHLRPRLGGPAQVIGHRASGDAAALDDLPVAALARPLQAEDLSRRAHG